MLQEIEEVSSTTKKLKINIPSEVIKSETDSVYNHIRATSKIPGFRPGKVPQEILKKKFAKNVEAEVIEKIVPKFYMDAIKEANIEPVTYPNIDGKLELVADQPLSFTVTVEVKPKIENLNYEGITLKEKTFTIEEKEIEKSINFLRENKALYSVTDEALQESDMAIIDCEASVEELSYKELPFVLGSSEMPKEFSDALTGKKQGDTAEVKIKFEDDHPNKTIAGKEITFHITIKEAKKKNLPPIDDELAKEAECNTLDELKSKISENLGKRKESQINLDHKKEILDELVKRHDFEIPKSMLQGEIDALVEKAKDDAMRKGETVKSDEELKKEFDTMAKENVKSVIILETIGKKENVEVSDEDTEEAMKEIAMRNNLNLEELTRLYAVREGSMDALKSRLFADKVLEFILEKSTLQK